VRGLIGVCHINWVGLIGVCHINGVGLIGVCHIDGVDLIGVPRELMMKRDTWKSMSGCWLVKGSELDKPLSVRVLEKKQ
jgi:hypothetical protein